MVHVINMKDKKLVFIFQLLLFISSVLIVNSYFTSAFQDNENLTDNLENLYLTDLIWKDVEVVSTECFLDSRETNIDVDINGSIHVVWSDATDYLDSDTDMDILYKTKQNNSDIWTSAIVISTESELNSYYPCIAADNIGNIHVIWYDETDYDSSGLDVDIFYKRFDADSSSWTITEVVSSTSDDQSLLPAIALDSLRNLHVTWQDWTIIDGIDPDILYRKWSSASKTWSSVELISLESSDFSFNPDICTDSYDNVHIVWQDSTDNLLNSGSDQDIFHKYWDVEGASWSTLELVSKIDTTSDAPSIVADAFDNLHVIWQNIEVDYQIYCSYQEFGRTDWANYVKVNNNDDDSLIYPEIESDILGNLHMVWYSQYSKNIIYKGFLTPSKIPTGEFTVNPISSLGAGNPCIRADSSGQIHLAWEDISSYGSSGSDRDIFYRKFGSIPVAPILEFIVPNPTDTNLISLEWNANPSVEVYHVYRSSSYIDDIQSLVPIATTGSNHYTDTLPSEGLFYYVVVAENDMGKSSISNCQYVFYQLPHLREITIITSLLASITIGVMVFSKVKKKK